MEAERRECMPEFKAYAVAESGDEAAPETIIETRTVIERTGDHFVEYHAEITNNGEQPVFLKKAVLFETSTLEDFAIGMPPYKVFRSGRHKNDMPGVFESGSEDERLEDVSLTVTESGDDVERNENRQVISDHLTLIQGEGGRILAITFLSCRDQLVQTCISLNGDAEISSLHSETLFGIRLDPHQTVSTESIRIAAVYDAEREVNEFAERRALRYGARNRRHPVVFCTWYYYGLTVSYEDVRTCLSIIRARNLPYEVFQVDEGWEVTLGEYEPNDRFPITMKQIAEEIREAGLIPGIWSSPFVAHSSASIWKTHPEWILKDRQGKPCLFAMNDTVYYVFDITDPTVDDYFRKLYHRFTSEWGYAYHKLDFTRAPVIFENALYHDPTVTLAQAYFRAVSAIREGMGEEAFFLMCGGLYDPVIGLVDAQRTGADVLSMWSSSINKGGKTAPYTIRQSMYRWYMNAWWANDPDALMIRRNPVMERNLRLTLGLLNDDEVRTELVNQFAGGGIMCQTEPLDRISDSRLLEIRHILPVLDRTVRPLNWFSKERFPFMMDVWIRKSDVHCVCLINWSDTDEKAAELDLSMLSLEEGKYAVCGFYSGLFQLHVEANETVRFGTIPPHGAEVIKVERMEDRPVVVASSGHYAMGAELRCLMIEEGMLHVVLDMALPTDTEYQILLPEPWRYRGEQIVRVHLNPEKRECRFRLLES